MGTAGGSSFSAGEGCIFAVGTAWCSSFSILRKKQRGPEGASESSRSASAPSGHPPLPTSDAWQGRVLPSGASRGRPVTRWFLCFSVAGALPALCLF